MDGKLLIIKRKQSILTMLIAHNRLEQLRVTPLQESYLGNIYIAKVQKMMPGLNAAFVDLGKGLTGYLTLPLCRNAIVLNRKNNEALRAGDEIVVQVTADAIKTKLPAVSAQLSLTGQYCVVMNQPMKVIHEKKTISYSGKIKPSVKAALKKKLGSENYGEFAAIIRTNAGNLEDISELQEELRYLQKAMAELIQTACYRTCFSCLWQEEAPYIKAVREMPQQDYEEIVTDRQEIYESLQQYYGSGSHRLRLYQDSDYSLVKLYGIESHLEKALKRKVWLDCGGFLYIEPTEALTVIDVNTGKFDNKNQNSFLQINMQAAEEIARQIRVRNLSGIIIIDFINMPTAENEELLNLLGRLCEKDSVKTSVIDMTPLGLVEITRKKTSKPIGELL